MKKILLCGYMGSGKTTVGRILSQKTGLPFLDLDHQIESECGMTVSEVFKIKSELHFRKLESRIFRELLSEPGNFILALGGGTPAYAGNHELLKGETVFSVYLKASIDTLAERLTSENATRPLVAGKSSEELKEFIAKHLFDRNFYYNQASAVVTIDGKSSEEIASEIIGKLT